MAKADIELGQVEGWGTTRPLRLYAADRRCHLYIIGQTGTGKSTLIKQIIAQDINAGAGLALIDPHGDLSSEILDHIPPHRVDDVVFLDPTDLDRPLGFNPFYCVNANQRALVASNITATFKHVWRDSWGPRLEYILYNTVAALLDAPDHLRPSFVSIPMLLVRDDYRERVIKHIADPRVRSFFVDEFCQWPDRQLAEAISPVQNKIGQFLSNPFIRNILGQWKSSIDLTDIMDRQRILIVRLPKGLLGEEPANLFGSLIASGLQQAAMRRANRDEAERTDFHLLIDEFHNFTTDSFANVLSEARKYGLTLTIAHQYIAQMTPAVRDAMFGNVGSLISFRVSAADAEHMANEIGDYTPSTFRALDRGNICCRMMIGGEVGQPIIGRTTPDQSTKYGCADNIRFQSRQRYGRDRNTVENRIRHWLA